ncbi:MAG: SAM-dependent DNA methyltransferase, partial [Candidatus Moranbacteria bacterium]|nr:SAM-dependent DNA methyltransferase [Candidatus Moranbacteria bacterium]
SLGVGGTGIKKRKESEHMWKVSIKEIEERNYNLDFKNPSKKENLEHKDPKEILEKIEKLEVKSGKLLKEIKRIL